MSPKLRIRRRWWHDATAFGQCVLAGAVLTGLLAGCSQTEPSLQPAHYPEIDLHDGVRQILAGEGIWDSPVLSADGHRLAVQAEVYRDPVLPYEVYSLGVAQRDESGAWGDFRIVREGIHHKWGGHTHFPIQPCFDATGKNLYFTHLEFNSSLSIPDAGSIRSWIAMMPWQGGDARKVITHDAWGLRPTEIIQHPRLSPDGRWLTFYARVHERTQGVYLLDLRTNRHYKLSHHHDKHPTWGPSGERIYFHHVAGGPRHRFDFFASGIEQSVLGYIELGFQSGELKSWRRVLFDGFGDTFIYHKHPAEIPGMDLLFFHGREDPDDNLELMVRRNVPGSQVYIVEPKPDGQKLKKAKHPCTSFLTRDLIFIAMPKGTEDYSLMFELTDQAVRQIEDTVINPPATEPAA
jgi:hypothetical protein